MEHRTNEKIKEYCYQFQLFRDEKEEMGEYSKPSLLKSNQDNETTVGPSDKVQNNIKETNDNDDPTCHKVRVYEGSITSKGTDVMAELIPVEKKVEEKPELAPKPLEVLPEAPLSFTGYFEDSNKSSVGRRIDMVLVLADDMNTDTESIKVNYLLSILKCGLEVEIEPGLMPIHKNLIFVKVHAPDYVLEEYGDIVGVKKYFKDSHVEYIKSRSAFINRFLCICTQLNEEKEWIKIVRKQYVPPLYYSNLERSLIVYKILLHLPYGEHVNNFGLERLLNRDIILDAFALHDGPYFYTQHQNFTEVNARQILFYYWTGLRNLFKMQPLNLIHEYFGSRIAFYFAFFQFYNQMLVLAAIGGIAMVAFGYFDTGYDTVREDTCFDKNDTYLCPRCNDFQICGFEKLIDHCLTADITNTLDNRLIIWYCLFVSIWAKLLTTLWRRKETYWLWLWELQHVKKQVTMRSQFNIDYNKPNRSTRTGILKNYNSGVTKHMAVLFGTGVTLLCVVAAVLFTCHLIVLKYTYLLGKSTKFPIKYGRYIIIALVVSANLLVLKFSEKIFNKLTYMITNLENHRSYESYERSVITKQCAYCFVSTFSIFFYFAYIKGLKYINPISTREPRVKPSSDQFNNCGPFRCMDELFVVLMVTQLLRQVIPKTLLFLRRYIFWIKTDYNQGKKQVLAIPSWEREYLLKPITKSSMLERFHYLALQFGILTLFAPAFPLAAILALLLNLFHIRYDAELFLLGSRRPLLIDVPGLDVWKKIFDLIAYVSVVTNAGILCFTSRIVRRYVYVSKLGNMTNFLGTTISAFETNKFYNTRFIWGMERPNDVFIPTECFYPGTMISTVDRKLTYHYIPILPKNWYYWPHDYKYELIWLKMLYFEHLLLLVFINIGMCALLIIQYFIPTNPQDIEESMKMEQKIKNHFLWNKTK